MDPPPRRVRVVSGLKAKAAHVEDADPDRLIKRMLASYGQAQLYEWYQNTTIGKVAFDVDGKTTNTTATALLTAALAGVATFFKEDAVLGGRVPSCLIAASHGLGPGHFNGDKLSFRIFVSGVRMRLSDVKARLVRLGLDKNRPYDGAIYGANQKLRMVGSIKTPEDRRPLILVDRDGAEIEPTPALLLDTLVQVVDYAWPLLEEPPICETPVLQVTAPTPSIKRTRQDVEDAIQSSPSQTTTTVSRRGRPPKTDSLPPEWREVLDNLGFKEIRSKGAWGEEGTGRGYSFSSSSRTRCPCCDLQHDKNNWFIVRHDDGAFAVKSQSERCCYRIVRPDAGEVAIVVDTPASLQGKVNELALVLTPSINVRDPNLHYHRVACTKPECLACTQVHKSNEHELREVIKDTVWTIRNVDPTCAGKVFHASQRLQQCINIVVQSPSHDGLGRLFMVAHGEDIWCDHSCKQIRHWTGHRWEPFISPGAFAAYVGSWTNTLLGCVKRMEGMEACGKQLTAALMLCKHAPQHKSLAEHILNTYAQKCQSIRFDQNDWLLGCDDCVVDLKTGQPREARREDYVSKSVGYTFLQPFTQEDLLPLRAAMEKVYPLAEERAFVQRFMYLCLSGHVEKAFLCLTDRRQGFNGKTFVWDLIQAALGEAYACEAKRELLYQNNAPASVNSHDAGLKHMDGKRVVNITELSGNRSFECAFLKSVTGGPSTIPVRGAGGAVTENMRWTAKIIIQFNENKCPKFDTTDGALVERMVVVQHRARFCTPQNIGEYEGEPHTFLADTALKERLLAQPQLMLIYMLEGRQAYSVDRLGPPTSCLNWRGALVADKDEVVQWAQENVRQAETGWFELKDAYVLFRATGNKLGRNRFRERLEAALQRGCFYKEKTIDNIARYGVFWGFDMTG